MSGSIMKGLNKRISMMEDMLKESKKKKKNEEILALKKEVRDISKMKHSIDNRELKSLKVTQDSIARALSSLGKIRIPSPS